MEKRIKDYIKYISKSLSMELDAEEREGLRKDMLVQIGFFQHERLIHLLVTLSFGILTVLTFFVTCFYQNIGVYLLLCLLLILLIPYIRHYYILENGIQSLYQLYDELID